MGTLHGDNGVVQSGPLSARWASRPLCFLVAFILALCLVPTVAFADEPAADYNVQTLATPEETGAPAQQSHYNLDSQGLSTLDVETSSLPSRYNLLELGLATTVKNQHHWGTCWAFGSTASLESNILVQQGAGSTSGALVGATEPDLSELHLVWFAGSPLAAGYDSTQTGEGASSVYADPTTPSWTSVINIGGFPYNATSVWSSWKGAVSEEEAPYQSVVGTYETTDEWNVPESTRFDSLVHVQDVDYLPSPATFTDPDNPTTGNYVYDANATAAIKEALATKGAVEVSYYADQSSIDQAGNSTYFNYNTWSQCVDEFHQTADPGTGAVSTAINHSVVIVGWDDNYSKDNFVEGHQPAGDGAWIVKNSWGTSEYNWGIRDEDGAATGCFYLSYYDESVGAFASTQADLSDADGDFDYDTNYQYDYLGAASIGKIIPGAAAFKDVQVANIFTSKGSETLQAVSATTANPGSQVSIQVYLLDDAATSPTQGTLVATQDVEFAYGGYHTAELNTPVELTEGQRFAVVESIQGREGAYFPLEIAATDPTDADVIAYGNVFKKVQTAKAAAGQSYYRLGNSGTWEDVTTLTGADLEGSRELSLTNSEVVLNDSDVIGNVMIKAFTTDRTEPTPVTPAASTNVSANASTLANTADSVAPATGIIMFVALIGSSFVFVGCRRVVRRRRVTSSR